MKNQQTNEGSVKQSSTSQQEVKQKIKDQLFFVLGDTSYGDFTFVKDALKEGDFQTAWEE